MEAGNDSGQPIGESAKTEGGERAADLPWGRPGTVVGPFFSKPHIARGYHDSGLLRAASLGITGAEKTTFSWGYAFGADKQIWKAASRTYRWAGAALLIGITLGLLLPLAYQMVSRG